jgi:hypothetical protein
VPDFLINPRLDLTSTHDDDDDDDDEKRKQTLRLCIPKIPDSTCVLCMLFQRKRGQVYFSGTIILNVLFAIFYSSLAHTFVSGIKLSIVL